MSDKQEHKEIRDEDLELVTGGKRKLRPRAR